MIQFNNITISPKADLLIIDAEIKNDSAFDNCYLKKIYIDIQDTYLTNGPSSDLVYEHDITVEDAKDEINSTIQIEEESYVRKLHIEIPQEEICASLSNNFFIVYLEADGEIVTNGRCCEYNTLIVGCTFYMKQLYNKFLAWIRELINSCEIPKNFLYTYLQYQALLTCVRTGNMLEAIKIYNKYIRNLHGIAGNIQGCGCNRR